ncbi:uncharacterized protein LOC117648221 [Thrips palmi]|uniref:Uncharacterized protein LOC117648221 n=1 Tax=Thrips palmi TaxID=161013 RepID=A0A6P8Z1X2_THRPL|nr:uncharacterized protein LOC117648221 [Thrips palmi]
MHQSYALQRQDIVNGVQRINETEEDDPQGEVQMAETQKQWPFLFYKRWQDKHFQLLTGNTIDLAVADYKENFLELLIDYMTSCGSDSSMTNVVLRRQWQRNGCNVEVQFLIAMTIISNYFHETGNLFVAAEVNDTVAHYFL